jgi:hypothetical protein
MAMLIKRLEKKTNLVVLVGVFVMAFEDVVVHGLVLVGTMDVDGEHVLNKELD